MGGAIYSTNQRDGQTNVRTLAVSYRVLVFEACSVRPASKVLRWILAGYSGLVVRRLSRSKYITLSESCTQRALNGMCSLSDGILNLAMALFIAIVIACALLW